MKNAPILVLDEATAFADPENEYKMQQNYSDGQWRDTVDEAADNKVLTFPNVIVLYTDIHTYPAMSQGPAVR